MDLITYALCEGSSDGYSKKEINNLISSVYKFKGSVAIYNDLPSSDQIVGDVYNVESDGSNYAWDGTNWDKLGGDIDLSEYQALITNNNKISSDLIDDTNKTNKFVLSTEKTAWNEKYNKPNEGIPQSDLTQELQNKINDKYNISIGGQNNKMLVISNT